MSLGVRTTARLESGYTGMTNAVWMTKAEFAAARRISVGSANRLIRQRRWERQPCDDGRTRVLVPRRWAEEGLSSDTAVASALMKYSSKATTGCEEERPLGGLDALQEEVIRLRAAIETTQSGRRQAELERDKERQGRITAERALSEARQQAEQAIQTAKALRNAKENLGAEERAEQITRDAASAQLRRLTEAMAARRSLGLWPRLRLAWRGE
jgi:hypothetical protein